MSGSTTCLKCPEGTVSIPGSTECTTCQVTVVRGFLKYKCVTSSGEEFYKCWNSNVTYQVPTQTCAMQKFTDICEDDPHYYQLCGFIPCNHNIDDQYGYCCNYICQGYLSYSPVSIQGIDWVKDEYTCDGKVQCHINKADELNCEHSDDEEQFQCPYPNITISMNQVCDSIWNCYVGIEEAHCNHTYGVTCKTTSNGFTDDTWLQPSWVCDGSSWCDGGEDEQDCANSTHHVRWCKLGTETNYLNERQLCGPVDDNSEVLLCTDHRDQLNCSNSVGECQVENTTTQLRRINLCDGFMACDNGIDEICTTPEQNCLVHKHQLCDNNTDCERGSDESHESCNKMIDKECERLVTGNNTKIPLDWLCDGTADCKDGKDEEKSNLKLCGLGERERCRPKSYKCEEKLICPNSNSVSQYVEFEKLCDNVDSCSGENSICQAAQDTVEPLTTTPDLYGSKRVGYCLPGIDSPELNCRKTVFTKLEKVSKTIVRPLLVSMPVKELRCKHMFGEAYVYTSCSNKCVEKNATCPLTILNSSSCAFIENRILFPSLTNQLTVVKRKKGFYDNEIFACTNGNCLPYAEVCNLADNCGDGSDEDGCIKITSSAMPVIGST